MTASVDVYGSPAELRIDESRVRLLFVEQSQDYAALVCEALKSTLKGHFEVVRSGEPLEAARSEVEAGQLDAVLVDLATHSDPEEHRVRIEEASSLARRVPVIVLTGDEEGGSGASELVSESAVRERIAGSPLPDEILRAVERHRRLGPCCGADPIVVRDPLRACATAFARIRRILAS